ncbi:WhiB family transcriptional regulator [Gordonia terrae]|uniref:WhiB family transcriptional regulator n=1 Tax=Gordonia hongkongensis TaxID=1701090 RepID=UPI0022B414DF|nr:WhiB family transcriptional regulator [Gordonia terrae]
MSFAKTPEAGVVSLLSEILVGLPKLDGAACVAADPQLFDSWHTREGAESFVAADARHERAAAVCGRCPARAECLEWADGEGGRFLGAMVVGGRRPNLPGRKKGTAA